MDIQIKKYDPDKDYQQLRALITSEGEEWETYLKPDYALNLERSITYVACVDSVICGYSRSMSDVGYFVWVIDLLVHQDYRGNHIGQQLLTRISQDYPSQDVFVMSDVDEYYIKTGYEKVGSIFQIS